MKTTFMGLVIFAILGIESIACNRYVDSQNQGESPGQQTVEGRVVAMDLEGVALDGPALITIDTNDEEKLIAVPSMGLPLCAGYENIADAFSISIGDRVSVAGSIDEKGRIIPCESIEHYVIVETTVTNQEVGLTFDYRKGPDGYALQDLDTDTSPGKPHFVVGYELMLKEDFEKPQGAESPPTITIAVFRNVRHQSASVWTDDNAAVSNIALAIGRVDRDATLAGANAVRYLSDGLYRNDVVIAAHGGFIYMIRGMFSDEDSTIREDFEPLLNSTNFIYSP